MREIKRERLAIMNLKQNKYIKVLGDLLSRMDKKWLLIVQCWYEQSRFKISRVSTSYLPTPPLGQDMTQGRFLSGV